MEFCPKCGTRLILARKQVNEQVISEWLCNKCGHFQQVDLEGNTQKSSIRLAQEAVMVIGEKEANIRTNPNLGQYGGDEPQDQTDATCTYL